MEVSFVSIPADTSVGVGRASNEEFETLLFRGGPKMSDNKPEVATEAVVPAQVAQPQVDLAKLERQAREAESSRVA
jgi:hypothetical protein